jgi:hypothetical protein
VGSFKHPRRPAVPKIGLPKSASASVLEASLLSEEELGAFLLREGPQEAVLAEWKAAPLDALKPQRSPAGTRSARLLTATPEKSDPSSPISTVYTAQRRTPRR